MYLTKEFRNCKLFIQNYMYLMSNNMFVTFRYLLSYTSKFEELYMFKIS